MNSPPKPRRAVGISGAARRSVRDERIPVPISGRGDLGDMMSFESCLVEQAVSDLPTLASQVFTLDKAQKSEFSRQKEELDIQQKLIKLGEEKLEELNGDMKCLKNKLFLAAEFNNDTNKRIKGLDAEIQKLVTSIVAKETNLKHVKESAEVEKRQLDKDIEKMRRHCDLVEEHIKSTSPTYAKLMEMRQTVESLREQKKKLLTDNDITLEELMSENTVGLLQAEINNMKHRLETSQNEAKLFEAKIEEQRLKNSGISQQILVAHKRNAAQVIRLKKQVNDLRLRNRQREEQLKTLRNDIIEGEKRLGENSQ